MPEEYGIGVERGEPLTARELSRFLRVVPKVARRADAGQRRVGEQHPRSERRETPKKGAREMHVSLAHPPPELCSAYTASSSKLAVVFSLDSDATSFRSDSRSAVV